MHPKISHRHQTRNVPKIKSRRLWRKQSIAFSCLCLLCHRETDPWYSWSLSYFDSLTTLGQPQHLLYHFQVLHYLILMCLSLHPLILDYLMSSSDFLWNSSKLILSYSTTATHSGSSSTTWSTTFAPLTMVNKNKSGDFTKRTNLPNPLCCYSNFASRLSSLTWLRNFTGDTYSLNPHQSRTLDPQAWSRTRLALIPNCQDPSLNSHPSLNVSSDLASSYLSGFGLEGKIGNLTVNCKESKVVAARQVKDRVRVYILDTQIRGFDRLIWSAPLLGYKIAELASVSSHSLFGHDYRNNNYY